LTVIAKGRGRQAFFNLFGILNCDTYLRLVSNINVGQRTIFNPFTPTDISPAVAPFLVERHSGVGFDELVPNSDLFTTLITEYPIKFSMAAESHPMMKLLINSGGKKCSPKLMQLTSNGTVKKVLKLYFVSGQKKKLSNKFLKSVDGCGQLSYIVLSGLFPIYVRSYGYGA
jgi:hypothetical protein